MESTRFDRAIELCGALKRLPRTGWVQTGVNDPESVADHSMRVAYLAIILCPPEVDRAKVVQMAIIHDLAESQAGDITPLDGVTQQDKYSRENAAWTNISESLGDDEQQKLWQEMEEGVTNEAKFVFQLDKLEMLIQADEYERLQPGLDLSQFFRGSKGFAGYDNFFTFPTTLEVYNSIKARRMAASKE
jgi:putative hydrolase of HD superfamily